MTAVANDLLAAIHATRAEAIKRRAVTVACSSANSTTANPSCGAGAGWIVFSDPNASLAVDPGEPVLLQREAMPGTITPTALNADGDEIAGAWYVAFADNGMAVPLSSAPAGTALRQLVLCDQRGNVAAVGDLSAARLLNVTPIGRPSVSRDIALIEAAGGC
jgi:type IV fimbrial biogenesis protein FimT